MTGSFYTLDRQWCFTYVNQRALDFFGTPDADLVGSNFWEVFPETQGSLLETQFRRAVQEPCSVSFEWLARPANRWIEVHANPTPRGLAVNFRDLNELKARQIQLLVELTQAARKPQVAPARLQQLLEDLQRTLLPER